MEMPRKLRCSKLTWGEVRQIRELRASGATLSELDTQFRYFPTVGVHDPQGRGVEGASRSDASIGRRSGRGRRRPRMVRRRGPDQRWSTSDWFYCDLTRGVDSSIPKSGQHAGKAGISSLAKIPAIQRAGANRPCACDWGWARMDCPPSSYSARCCGGAQKGWLARGV